jgi:hypothetical protein
MVDGTVVDEPGRTGSLWRVLCSLDLAELQRDSFPVTDTSADERFQRIPIRRGDLILGNRVYGTPPGVGHVLAQGGDVLVRTSLKQLPLYTPQGRRWSILTRLRALRVRQVGQWTAYVHGLDGVWAGRLMPLRRSLTATHCTRRRLQQRARRKQHTISAATWEATQYMFVRTKRRSRWRETRFMLREIMAPISPRLGSAGAPRAWSDVARGLCEPPRKRKCQSLG